MALMNIEISGAEGTYTVEMTSPDYAEKTMRYTFENKVQLSNFLTNAWSVFEQEFILSNLD